MALIVAVWFAGIGSVAPAFVAGAVVALSARHSILIARPILLALVVSFIAALVSNILLGGPLIGALLRGVGIWLAIVPAFSRLSCASGLLASIGRARLPNKRLKLAARID